MSWMTQWLLVVGCFVAPAGILFVIEFVRQEMDCD